MTLGSQGRNLRELEDRITALETGDRFWKGDERRSDADTAFSDEQVERIKAIFDERAEVHAGRAFFRLVLWTLGSACAGAATIFFAYLKIKG